MGNTRGDQDDQGLIRSWATKNRRETSYIAKHSTDPAEDSEEEREQHVRQPEDLEVPSLDCAVGGREEEQHYQDQPHTRHPHGRAISAPH